MASEELITLIEHVDDWKTDEVLFDQQASVIRNIALTGANSKNGYEYEDQALEEAVNIYNGKPIFLDHPAQISKPYDRSTRDFVGNIINPRYENRRIKADIQVVPTESGKLFQTLADNICPGIGMSHVILAEKNKEQTRIQKIRDVICVDAVVFPATTNTLKEQRAETSLPDYAEIQTSLAAKLTELELKLEQIHKKLVARENEYIPRTKSISRINEHEKEASALTDQLLTALRGNNRKAYTS